MGEELVMSQKERWRLVEVAKVEAGEQKIVDAAAKLGLSYRQTKRIVSRCRREGDRGLCHRNRGRPSNRAVSPELKAKVLEFYRKRLQGFGPTLAAEKLEEAEGIAVDHETLRRWLSAAGLWKRSRRRRAHRRRRERREHFGELVQMDGSIHDWLGTGRLSCLMVMVDDATGRTYARLFEAETTEAAMRCLWWWVRRHGVPTALYTDKDSVYHTNREPTPAEQLSGEKPLTAFGRSCRKLGITLVPAHSPQAKGRVERKNGVFQDRLVKELRFQGIETPEGVNELLDGRFLEDLNRRFAKAPAREADYHRCVPAGLDLASVFAGEEERTVGNDWTVRYRNRVYQISGPSRALPPSRGKVTVQRRLDGSLRILYRGREVAFHPVLPGAEVKQAEADKSPGGPRRRRRRWSPPPDHPWRKDFSARRSPAVVSP